MKNWHLDDWVSSVYGTHRTHRLADVLIRNTNRFGTRYAECREDGAWLRAELRRGASLVAAWLAAHPE